VLGNFPENSVYYQEVEKLIVEAENKREQAAEEQKKKEAEELLSAQKQNAVDTINEALRYYAEGKIKSAVNILNRVMQSPTPGIADLKKRAGSLKKDMGYATSLFRKGDQAYTSGQIDTALGTWTALLKIEQKLLGHKKGHFSRRVRQKMADEYGAMALKEYSKGDFSAAYRHSKLALNQKGNHPKALEVKKMLKAKSKRLYQEGYILEAYNPEKAMEKWKLITKICDSNSTYYQRALGKINGK
jgi:tetratricopeptide (TPR) repeat protein